MVANMIQTPPVRPDVRPASPVMHAQGPERAQPKEPQVVSNPGGAALELIQALPGAQPISTPPGLDISG